MSYFNEYEMISYQSQGFPGSPSSIVINQRMPCSTITHTGVNVNAFGQLELSAGYTHIIMGTAYAETNSSTCTCSVQWYDVTNSLWLGRGQKMSLATQAQTQPRTSVARFVMSPSTTTTVEFRISNVTAGVDYLNSNTLFSGYVGKAWYGVITF